MLKERGTVRIRSVNLWTLAKRMGVRDAERGIPGADWPHDRISPARLMLAAAGSTEQSKIGVAWYRRVGKLATAVHRTTRKLNRADVATTQAKERLGRRASLLDRFFSRPDVMRHGAHQDLGHLPYLGAVALMIGVEADLNLGALQILGDSKLRLFYAVGLGVALFLLAHLIGAGLKNRKVGVPSVASPGAMALSALGASAIILPLALLRDLALKIATAAALAQANLASTGSMASGRTEAIHVPSIPWPFFAALQAGVFLAAVAASYAHASRLTDERAQLVRGYRSAERLLDRRLDEQVQAAAERDDAGVQYDAAVAETLESAEESARSYRVHQLRYDRHNLLSRDGEIDPSLITEPIPVEESGWKQAPEPGMRIGPEARPRTDAIWPEGFTFPAPAISPNEQDRGNGHRPSPDRILRLVPRDPQGDDAA